MELDHLTPSIFLLMRYIFAFLFFSYASFTNGQEVCYTIRDSKTDEVIPYATVYSFLNHTGYIADDSGKFCIINPQEILITALGYNDLSTKLSNMEIIYLVRKDIQLNEVLVLKSKESYKKVSFKSGQHKLVSNGYSPNSSFPIAQYFDNQFSEHSTFESIEVELLPRKDLSDIISYRLRLRILSSLDGLPNEDLLNENLIIDVGVDDESFKLDVLPYNLELPKNGFWVAVQTLGVTRKDLSFQVIKDGEFGNYEKLKKRIVVKDHLSPSFKFEKSGSKNAAEANWRNQWNIIEIYPKMSFSMTVRVLK